MKRRRRIYENKYSDIRHKFFAHKEIADAVEVDELFAKTNVQELRRLVVFMQRLHEALWQLFYNGHKPVLKPMRHSVKRMRDLPSPEGGKRQCAGADNARGRGILKNCCRC